jgi:serine/threonine-protein kinase RsbW
VDVKFSLVFPRDALSLGVMRQVLGDTLGALGVAPDCVSDILLAVTEACTNVLLHGGPGRAYEVLGRVGGSRCLLEVMESGARFDPRRNLWAVENWRPSGHRAGHPRRGRHRSAGWLTGHVSWHRGGQDDGESDPGPESGEGLPVSQLPESGRGLQIMRAVMDDVTLRSGVGRGTSVSIEKQLTWRSDAPLAALSGAGLREAG